MAISWRYVYWATGWEIAQRDNLDWLSSKFWRYLNKLILQRYSVTQLILATINQSNLINMQCSSYKLVFCLLFFHLFWCFRVIYTLIRYFCCFFKFVILESWAIKILINQGLLFLYSQWLTALNIYFINNKMQNNIGGLRGKVS